MSFHKTKGTKQLHPADLLGEFRFNELSGLKITFINMPLRETAKPNTPPEGPAILASVVRKYGAEPSIVDLNAYRVKDDIAYNKGLRNGRHLTYKEAEHLMATHFNNRGDQDIIALSGMITTLRWQEEIARIVRRLQPDSFLVSGNGLATEIKDGLFKWIPELDAIARSEGDDVILVIARDAKMIKEKGLRHALNSGKLSPYYAGEISGKHRFIYEGDRPRNLDELPYPAWDLLESDPYEYNILEDYINVPVWGIAANNSSATPFTMRRSLTTVSSRGCPYNCAFCYRGAQGERKYGVRSVEHIARQLSEYIEKYTINFIGFPDDNFAVSRKRIECLPKVFKDHGINLKWGTHARMDEADDRLFVMAEAGCVYIGFGAESASEHILRRMNKGGFILKKGITSSKINGNTFKFPATMMDAIKNCCKTGIHANCTWIMGYPGETIEHLKNSIAFILWQQELLTRDFHPGSTQYETAISSINKRMFTATAYPGTAMFKDEEVRKLLTKDFGLSFNNIYEPICDEAFHNYVLELDDATKVLCNKDGVPLNFSAMPMDTFLQARELIDSGNIEKILDI